MQNTFEYTGLLKPFTQCVHTHTLELIQCQIYFDELEKKYENDQEEINQLLWNNIPKVDKLINNFMYQIDILVKDLSPEAHEIHGKYLRSQIRNQLLTAGLYYRTIIKPRKYSGDSETMRMMYDNGFEGTSVFGKLLHKHAVNDIVCQAVRNRRVIVATELVLFQAHKPIEILSVACGPACEISDIFKNAADTQRYNITLLDQDAEALKEATCNIKATELRIGDKINVNYIQQSVVHIHKIKHQVKYNCIYSMGLFDYLPKHVAQRLAKQLYNLLAPGGLLLIGNYHVDNPRRYVMEYWTDWKLIHRTEDEMIELLPSVNNIDVQKDSTGIQMFLRAKTTGLSKM